jgi:cyclopropane-fatty-acyl-phospholipid synthase
LLSCADIQIDGHRPWDIQVHHPDFYRRVIARGSLGVGESYMDGWWDCQRLDEMFCRVLRERLDTRFKTLTILVDILKARLANRQRPDRSSRAVRHHYDRGDELYRAMLDPSLIYSCGYWKEARTLEEAQAAKLRLVAGKLGLTPGMRVLDIGCGWGGAARYMAEHHHVEVVGITVSENQALAAKRMCKGLPVEIRLRDYRRLEGAFDRIFSIGMFEHVGYKNYKEYFRVVRRCLKEDGLFLLQTIGMDQSTCCTDPWIERYIFPNSMIPSARQITAALEGQFLIEDWHNFGADYDTTLMQWYQNFVEKRSALSACADERFFRMWSYYLLSCAGSFRARRNQLWQLVLSARGVPGGYRSLR